MERSLLLHENLLLLHAFSREQALSGHMVHLINSVFCHRCSRMWPDSRGKMYAPQCLLHSGAIPALEWGLLVGDVCYSLRDQWWLTCAPECNGSHWATRALECSLSSGEMHAWESMFRNEGMPVLQPRMSHCVMSALEIYLSSRKKCIPQCQLSSWSRYDLELWLRSGMMPSPECKLRICRVQAP